MPNGSWQTKDHFTFPNPYGKGILVPLRQPLWPLPGRPVEYGSDIELFKEMCKFMEHHLEVRDKRICAVMACYVLLTWRIEEFDVVPYLYFLGPKNTGKSRALELLEQVCYRGWRITHPTGASVFFVVDRYYPTVLADNYEFWPKETRNELDGLFNAGYRRGALVPRRPREGEHGPELIVYKVFSSKALAGAREPVESLGSRCILIRMARNQWEVPLKIDLAWAQDLRSKLLCYRFRHFETGRSQSKEIMNRYGRVGEIFYALLEVAPSDEIRDMLTEFALGVFEDQREEEATSLEAEVVKAIVICLDEVQGDRLATKNIVEKINEDRDEKDRIRPQRVGWILARLGFKKGRMPDAKGSYAIVIDRDLIDRLAATYDVTRAETSSTSIPPKSCSDAQLLRMLRTESGFLCVVSEQLSILGGIKGVTEKGLLGERIQAGVKWLSDPKNLDDEGWAPLDGFTKVVGGPETVQLMLREGLITLHPSKPNRVRLVRR